MLQILNLGTELVIKTEIQVTNVCDTKAVS
jgi:hypothetical protein